MIPEREAELREKTLDEVIAMIESRIPVSMGPCHDDIEGLRRVQAWVRNMKRHALAALDKDSR